MPVYIQTDKVQILSHMRGSWAEGFAKMVIIHSPIDTRELRLQRNYRFHILLLIGSPKVILAECSMGETRVTRFEKSERSVAFTYGERMEVCGLLGDVCFMPDGPVVGGWTNSSELLNTRTRTTIENRGGQRFDIGPLAGCPTPCEVESASIYDF
jgi:hypothetical protein